MLFLYFKISINFTSSMPYGVYAKSKPNLINHGDYVLICMDESATAIGLKNGYLETGKDCNGSMPLIKKVVAIPFQQIELTDSYLSVDGVKVPAATSYLDSNSRTLAIFPRGKYQRDCYWLLGDRDIAHSWDSRYWGCVAKGQIIAKVEPWLTW